MYLLSNEDCWDSVNDCKQSSLFRTQENTFLLIIGPPASFDRPWLMLLVSVELLFWTWTEMKGQYKKGIQWWSHWTHKTISSSFSSSESDTSSSSPLFLLFSCTHSHICISPRGPRCPSCPNPSLHSLLSLPLLFFSSKLYTSYILSIFSFRLLKPSNWACLKLCTCAVVSTV